MFNDIYYRILDDLVANDKNISLPPKSDLVQLNTSALFMNLLLHIYNNDPNSSIGVQFSHSLNSGKECDFLRLISTSSTLGEGIRNFVRYYHLLGLYHYPSVCKDSNYFSISLAFPYNSQYKNITKRFMQETFFTFISRFISELINEEVKPLAVHFDFHKPDYHELYDQYLGCPIRYRSTLPRIVFKNLNMESKLTDKDTNIHEAYIRKAHDFLQTYKKTASTSYQITSILMNDHSGLSSSARLASTMNLSLRGLQKRLKAEKSSISDIRTHVRVELCKIYLLQKNMSLEETAKQLGFQSTASLKSFFKTKLISTANNFLQG